MREESQKSLEDARRQDLEDLAGSPLVDDDSTEHDILVDVSEIVYPGSHAIPSTCALAGDYELSQ